MVRLGGSWPLLTAILNHPPLANRTVHVLSHHGRLPPTGRRESEQSGLIDGPAAGLSPSSPVMTEGGTVEMPLLASTTKLPDPPSGTELVEGIAAVRQIARVVRHGPRVAGGEHGESEQRRESEFEVGHGTAKSSGPAVVGFVLAFGGRVPSI